MNFKNLFLVILIILPFLCGAQERSDKYKLFKNGKEYQRPIVYLLEDSFKKIYDNGSEIYFLSKGARFVHYPSIHSSTELQRKEFSKIDFNQPQELYSLEEKEYNEKAKIILEETGVEPIPPIDHSILKIYILRKKKSSYCAYEVKWL